MDYLITVTASKVKEIRILGLKCINKIIVSCFKYLSTQVENK